MGVIVPAVLPASREDLDAKLARFVGLVDTVQLDVIDGSFASPASWPYTSGTKAFEAFVASGGPLPHVADFKFEIDLMTARPEEAIGSWVALGASRITVHLESTTYLPRIVSDFNQKYGHERGFAPDLLSFGFAIGMQANPMLLEPFIKDLDYVQFMGIDVVGKQGMPFDPGVIERVRAFKRAHPDTEVQVDGGVTLETAPALLDAGADRLIVGHALRDASDVAAALRAFTELTEKYGIYR
ncbi:MAG TPA: hypothetical protein VHC20_01690 [Candidatus Paceibacterota bacterium]|nr:hypothetical protein [Candidatus Paceibacterota bacterium]